MSLSPLVVRLLTLLVITLTAQTAEAALALSFQRMDVPCTGGSHGRLTVTVTGGSGQYAYAWSPNVGIGPEVTGLSAGTYRVTVTDLATAEVVESDPQEISQPAAQLHFSASQTNIACAGSSTGAAAVMPTGGTPPYAYEWSLPGESGPSVEGLAAGTYRVSVTDDNGCQAARTVSITEPPPLQAVVQAQTNTSCYGGSNGTVTAAATGGTPGYTYRWTPTNQTTPSLSGRPAGTYTVTVTDANACTSSASATITQPQRLSMNSGSQMNIACNGGSNGSIHAFMLGGTGAYTYSWSPNIGSGPAVSGLTAGTYDLTVVDENTCQFRRSFTITEPSETFITVAALTDVSCHGSADGTAAISVSGGTPSYRYAWAPSGQNTREVTGLSPGTHTVTVTDSNWCQHTRQVTVQEPAPLEVTTSGTNVSCHDGSDGSASAIASGGTGSHTYAWSPGGGTAPGATGLSAGAYTVTVSDDNACTTSASVTIEQPTPLEIVPTQTDVSCPGGSDGMAAAGVSGGTGSYAYAWSPLGSNTPSVSGLAPGAYSLTVTDGNACARTQGYTITEPPEAVITVDAIVDATCHGSADGSASVSVAGGTPGYTYAWSPGGGTEPNLAGQAAGAYAVTITDANGCQYSHSLTVAEPPALEVTASDTGVSCHGGSDGAASAVASGGTGSYTYAWSPGGGTAPDATGLSAGAYTVTVSDDNACATSASVTVTEPPETVITVDAIANATCHGSEDGGASVSVAGGTPGYTYAWSPSGGTEPSLEDQAAGTYTVTVRDANACETTHSLAIAEPEAIAVSLAASTPADCSDEPGGVLTVAVTGGSDGYAYDWSPGEPTGDGTESISGLAVGAYAVHVEDMSGCAGEGTFEVVPATDIAPVATGTSATVAQDGSVGLTLTSTYAGCFDRVYRVVEGPEHGTLDGTPPELVYTPAPGYFGADAFTFEVTAGGETSAPALVALIVTETPVSPENTIPTAQSMTVTTEMATPVTLTLGGSDLDGDPLTFIVETEPRFGTLSGTPPLVTYTPTGAGAYEDEFTFVVDDGEAVSAPATVSVIVVDPVDPGKSPPPARKDDDGGCSAAGNGELLAALLLVGAFLGLRRREGATDLTGLGR